MTVFGFCRAEQRDVPLTERGYCQTDGTLAIPPSFGRGTQTWRDGNWSPVIERPANYQYRPKVHASSAALAPPVTLACEWCLKTFEYQPRGGTVPRYDTTVCKSRALNARRREARTS